MKVEIGNFISFKFDRESLLTLLICVVWASMLFTFARGIINRLPVLGDHTEAIIVIVTVTAIVMAVPSLINKFCLADYLFFFALVFYYVANYVFFPDNAPFLTENAYMCLCCVFPYYFIGRVIDIDKLFNLFVLLSVVCIYMDLFYYLVYSPGNKIVATSQTYDNMFTAYQSLPHVAMLMWATLRKFSIFKAVTTLLGILFLFSCGTRGTLVCLGFFTIIYFLFYMNFKGAIYVKSVIVAVVLVTVAFLKEIAVYLFGVFTNFNLSTRIIEKFVYGDLGNDTQRGALRDIIYKTLESGDYPLGMGVFGSVTRYNFYAHFLPLDLASTFGFIIASIILLLLFLLIGRAYWAANDKITREFILFTFSISIIKLMFSSTFLLEPFFFLLIGICVRILIIRRMSSPVYYSVEQK